MTPQPDFNTKPCIDCGREFWGRTSAKVCRDCREVDADEAFEAHTKRKESA